MSRRIALALLVLLLAVGPASLVHQTGAQAQIDPAARDYWPTDGWQTAAPEEHSIDPAALAAIDARVPTETPDLSALVVVRHGYVVYERAYNGYDPAEPLNIRSVTKSVTGSLIGIALNEGFLTSLDQTVGELIPERIPDDADPRVAEITVRQLLTMTSGLAWDAGSDWPTLTASDNWVDLTLSQPVVGIPGETYVYNTGGSHLLAVIVEAVTGQDAEDYAQEKLFGPLGIEAGEWMRSPQDEPSGGSGLELTAHDMAKLGYLYLNNGVWDGVEIIPADFAQAATIYQSVGDATGGWANYGYQWWVTATGAGYPAYFALGYGGQHVFVVPALDLVVVTAIERRVDPSELRTPRYLIESIAAATAPDVPGGV
jgi:CubicO group peptidase (beta-lactamase class C family)